jgi:hypothetical protein
MFHELAPVLRVIVQRLQPRINRELRPPVIVGRNKLRLRLARQIHQRVVRRAVDPGGAHLERYAPIAVGVYPAPTRSRASITRTGHPASLRLRAADKPAIPAPMMSTGLVSAVADQLRRRPSAPRRPRSSWPRGTPDGTSGTRSSASHTSRARPAPLAARLLDDRAEIRPGRIRPILVSSSLIAR